MSSIHTYISLILYHTVIIWTVYASAIIENDRKKDTTKSQDDGLACRNEYFGDSSCQANIKQYIKDALNTVLTRSDENLDEKIRVISAKIETLERKMDDKLDKCSSNARKGPPCVGSVWCPSGYEYYERDTFWFKFYNMCKSWSEARKVCQQDGGDLISLKAENFNFFKIVSLSKAAGNCSDVWVGATDISSEGQWYWLNGDRVASTFWGPYEPNNLGGNEHCVDMLSKFQYKLNDNKCSYGSNFICQIV